MRFTDIIESPILDSAACALSPEYCEWRATHIRDNSDPRARRVIQRERLEENEKGQWTDPDGRVLLVN